MHESQDLYARFHETPSQGVQVKLVIPIISLFKLRIYKALENYIGS